MGWQRARLSGQNRLVTEGGIIVAGSLLLTGAIWLAQQQIDESVLQVRQSLREEFYPQEIEQERRQKKQQLAEERNALRETLSAPVSREQASGDLLAEIADIHDMAISRDGNTLYAAIEDTNSIVVFDLGQKKILHTFTAPIAKEKSVKHCGGCKDQGVIHSTERRGRVVQCGKPLVNQSFRGKKSCSYVQICCHNAARAVGFARNSVSAGDAT